MLQAFKDSSKQLYTVKQVHDILKQEENEKIKLLQANYQLKKKQTLDYVKNDFP